MPKFSRNMAYLNFGLSRKNSFLLLKPCLPLCLVLLPLSSSSTAATTKAPPAEMLGLVKNRTADRPCVETDSGFMVSFAQTIPGTDVVFEMVPIPGGKFLMGSPAEEHGRSKDEGTQVEVEVPPLWIAKYEVTWAEYKLYMSLCGVFEQFNDLGIRQVLKSNQLDAITAPSKLYEPGFTFAPGDGPRHPAVSMSQFAAKQYTKWLSLLMGQFYRLPTEAEWEYACRAGSTTAYSFGEDVSKLGDHAWYDDNSEYETHPVGEKQPNAWGLYDMHGSVSEWVLDAYDADWYQQLAARNEPISADAALCTPMRTYPRVLRGGSWNLEPLACRSAARRQSSNDWRSYDPNAPKSPWWFASDESQDVGFRIVRPLQEPTLELRHKYWDADVVGIQQDVDYRIDEEGRGERGLVDPTLPEAIRELSDGNAP